MNFQLPFQALYLVLLLPTVLARCFPLRPQRPLQPESTLPKIATVIRQEKPSRFLMPSSKVLILPSDIQKQRMTAQINDSFLGPENQNIGLNAIQNWIGIVENNLQSNLGEGDFLITEQSNLITKKILDEYREKYLADNLRINIYDDFIELLKKQEYDKKTYLEKHHILPRHADGSNENTNILKVTPKDHTWAHFFRYLQFGELGDATAFLMRQNQTAEAIALRSQLVVESNKRKGVLFWDPVWQSEQGLKGGSKGGSANTEKQFLARQKIGNLFGKKVGKSRQSGRLKEMLQNKWYWCHESSLMVCTLPCETFQELVNELNKAVPNSIRNNTSFIKVFYGERKQMYGWRLVGKVIRSEAEGGMFSNISVADEGPSERSETST